MNTFKPIISNDSKQESSKCVFIHAQPKPISHFSNTTSGISNLRYNNNVVGVGNSKIAATKTGNNLISEDSKYTKYIFHNAKEFRDKFKVDNTVLEKIWDDNFEKKNGNCPNCNIYGICKPINNKCLHNQRKFPFGLIVSIVENPTKEEDFTYICYMCYNEHLQVPGCLMGATAPMDINDGNYSMHDEYMNIFRKYNKRSNPPIANTTK